MAKKSAIQKNLDKEKQVKKNKSRRDRLKAICSNRSLPMEQRFEAVSYTHLTLPTILLV